MRAALMVLTAALLGAALSGAAPSAAYGHAVLGKTPEWTGLTIVHGPVAQAVADGHSRANATIFPQGFFEDVAPRPVDLDDEARPEIIAVHTDPDLGARLVVIASVPEPELLAATPFIQGRIATRDGRPTILTADAGWTQIMAKGLINGMLTSREFAIYEGPHSFDTVPGCA